MMEWIMDMDSRILLFFQDVVRDPVLTPVFTVITTLGNGAVIWILISLCLLLSKKTQKTAFMCAVAMLVSLLVNNLALKNIVGRIRPYEMVQGLIPLIGRPGDYSFPSGHTCASFAAAGVYWRMLPKKFGIPLVILAAMIAFSRLYVGVHYPTDVLAGLLIGLFAAWAARHMQKYVRSHRKKVE